VDNMPYTLAVLKEALRRYSVVPVVTRSLKEDDCLGGCPVPAGEGQVCWAPAARGLKTPLLSVSVVC